jgi:hypothetical protein
MAPKGNRTEKRGHRPKVGGEKSGGTIVKKVRLPVEILKKLERKIGTKRGAFSATIRLLISNYLYSTK